MLLPAVSGHLASRFRVGRRRHALTAALALVVLAPSPAAAAGTWSASGPLQVPRSSPTLTELPNGKVLVAGGTNNVNGPVAPTATAELYNPATGTSVLTGSLTSARTGHTATLLSGPNCGLNCGKVLVAGGSGLASAELYDPLTGMWSATGAMAGPRTAHSATLLAGGKVLVAGGFGPATLTTSELYDPAAGTWSPAATMGGPRREHTATRLGDGRVLAGGGRGAALEDVGTAEIYDPADNLWRSGGDLVVPRAFHTATLLTDGRVLVAGGRAGTGGTPTPRRSAELFDPSTGTTGSWSATASMAEGHSSHVAGRLPDGSVLIAGLSSPNRAETASSERYDPAAATWRYSGSMTLARGLTGYAVLSGAGCAPRCGQVVAAGGARSFSQLDTVDVYDPNAPTPPGGVGDLTATATSTSTITLSFSAPPSLESFPPPASRYAIRQSATPILSGADFAGAAPLCGGVCTFSPQNIGDRLTLDVGGLTPGATYHYALRALDDGNGVSDLSNDAAATTVPVPLGADLIGDLGARALSARRVELTFGAPGAGGLAPAPSTDYVIRQATGATAPPSLEAGLALCGGVCRFTPPAVGAPVALTVTGLTPNRVYHYAVRATTFDGSLGGQSNVVTIRTPRDRVAPGRAGILPARAMRTRIALRFKAAGSDGTTGPPVRRYVVKQASAPITSARGFLRAASLCPKAGCRFAPVRVGQHLTLNVTRLRPGRTYYFAIRALDDAGNLGPRSQSIRVRTRAGLRK
jgi:hypothetical protein